MSILVQVAQKFGAEIKTTNASVATAQGEINTLKTAKADATKVASDLAAQKTALEAQINAVSSNGGTAVADAKTELKAEIQTAVTGVKSDISNEVTKLLDGTDPEAVDGIKEIISELENNKDAREAMKSATALKADKAAVDTEIARVDTALTSKIDASALGSFADFESAFNAAIAA